MEADGLMAIPDTHNAELVMKFVTFGIFGWLFGLIFYEMFKPIRKAKDDGQ